MPRLELQLLGPFRAMLNGQPVTDQLTGKLRALLGYLAVEAGRPHHRESLAGLLWSDQPTPKALHNLRQALSSLRKILADDAFGQPVLLLDNETVCFDLTREDLLDVRAFRQALDTAFQYHLSQDGRGRVNIRLLRQAAALYRGAFLDQLFITGGSLFEDWVTLQREALSHKAIEALAMLAEYHERRGEYALARQQFARLLEIAPWDENAHREQMRLLALDGQWSAAQSQYVACRRYLRDDLGVEPSPETNRLFELIRRGEKPQAGLTPSVPPAPNNLPVSLTPFVGRETELAELHDLLVDPHQRLVTLLGPGGIGKTRLALEAAREQVGLFSDGVCFVPLASSDDPQSMLPSIAAALGLTFSDREKPITQLINYLRKKQILLVLDNCEFLVSGSLPEGVERLADILDAAPSLVVLATSRQRLNLQEEYLYPLDGLAYPRSAAVASRSPESYSAIALFVRHAHRVQRNFCLGETEQRSVIRICQMLDGLPLGLELAAAALWTRSCVEVADELERSLGSLSAAAVNLPERHRSLNSAFEFSWQLLTPAEQSLFSRLSVFRGGFDLEAAERVAEEVSAHLSALVDKSFLRREASGCFEWHEALRQFAAEKLSADPASADASRSKHAHYFAGYLTAHHQDLTGPRQVQALDEIADAFDNIRAAWDWLVSTGRYFEIEGCADSLYQFCISRTRFREGLALLSGALENLPEHLAVSRVKGILLVRQGALRERVGEFERSRAALEEGRALLERLGDLDELAFCLIVLSGLTQQGGDYTPGLHLAQDSLALYEKAGIKQGRARALYLIGRAYYRLGQIEDARRVLEASLSQEREMMNLKAMVGPLNVLADVLCHVGEYEQARKLFEEGLEISRSLGDQYGVGLLLNNLGTVDYSLVRYESAEALFQQSREICQAIGDQVGEAMALSNLGEVTGILGNYAKARQATRQALQISRALQDHWTILACLNALGDMAFDAGDYADAWAEMIEAVRLERETQTLQMLMRSLITLGGVLLKTGQAALGKDVLAVALRHPACQVDYVEKGNRWLAEMGDALPDDSRPLDEIVAELLASEPPNGEKYRENR